MKERGNLLSEKFQISFAARPRPRSRRACTESSRPAIQTESDMVRLGANWRRDRVRARHSSRLYKPSGRLRRRAAPMEDILADESEGIEDAIDIATFDAAGPCVQLRGGEMRRTAHPFCVVCFPEDHRTGALRTQLRIRTWCSCACRRLS